MAEYHFPIPGSIKENEIVVFVRRHFVAFLGQFLLAFLLLIIPVIIIIIIFAFHFDTKIFQGLFLNFLVLILSAYYLVIATFTFVSWVSFYYNCYIITRTEIIEITQIGFFGRKVSQLSLLRVQDVSSDIKGFLATFFAYGDVLVETAGERETFLLQSVPNPQEISSKIMAIHDEIIETEGRHHQILEGEGVLVPGKIKTEEKTPYQELLEKEKIPKQEISKEGEVSKDNLDEGGEVDLRKEE
ncbi:MAG: PH domain-containing protein [Patescibacteria group bacterium]|nr:PH domain-containing protein [Patescibacteria group bacterium]